MTPAAKRGRTTWRRGETAATLGHGEGLGAKLRGEGTAPEGNPTRRQKDRRNLLTRIQRGFRSACAGASRDLLAAGSSNGRSGLWCAGGSGPDLSSAAAPHTDAARRGAAGVIFGLVR